VGKRLAGVQFALSISLNAARAAIMSAASRPEKEPGDAVAALGAANGAALAVWTSLPPGRGSGKMEACAAAAQVDRTAAAMAAANR
jgi:hypothetical protein